jgi:formate hydrogenlyase subunit 3/multisubunit Na+/H+ antiporter MnhD subunit
MPDLLGTLFILIVILVGFTTIIVDSDLEKRYSNFYVLVFVCIFFSICCFNTNNLFWFFIYFEVITLPIFILIFTNGGKITKIKAAESYIIFSVFSGTLLGLSAIYIQYVLGTVDIIEASSKCESLVETSEQLSFIYLAAVLMLFAFLVKLPSFPFHL